MIDVMIPVSVGELFDKITILEIKTERIKAEHKLANIRRELASLQQIVSTIDDANILHLVSQLKHTNLVLWDIEEQKRMKEKAQCFDQGFIELARAVYINNDIRAAIKREINVITGSPIVEEKSHEKLSGHA
jgi:hypothetical protein